MLLEAEDKTLRQAGGSEWAQAILILGCARAEGARLAERRLVTHEGEGSNKGFDAAGVGGSQDACCPCSGLEAQAWRPPTHAAGRARQGSR